ncbi:MAG: hypothetical protein KAR14_02470 [Candidatus Aminicenantes bacterium]|nr:hypothetical protein [Candidatus Aminicenantes bacterium]
MRETLKPYLQKKIVVDTRSSWIYIGTLEKIGKDTIELSEVDVHDSKDTHTTKEIYLLDSRKTGIKSNRDKVYVNLDYIISFSPLEDVKNF